MRWHAPKRLLIRAELGGKANGTLDPASYLSHVQHTQNSSPVTLLLQTLPGKAKIRDYQRVLEHCLAWVYATNMLFGIVPFLQSSSAGQSQSGAVHKHPAMLYPAVGTFGVNTQCSPIPNVALKIQSTCTPVTS